MDQLSPEPQRPSPRSGVPEPQLLGPPTATTEASVPSSLRSTTRGHHDEKPSHCKREQPQLSTTREKQGEDPTQPKMNKHFFFFLKEECHGWKGLKSFFLRCCLQAVASVWGMTREEAGLEQQKPGRDKALPLVYSLKCCSTFKTLMAWKWEGRLVWVAFLSLPRFWWRGRWN